MRKLLLSALFLAPFFVFGQEWIQNLPKEKLENQALNFNEIQKAFNDYYESLNVVNGKREVNGEKVKVPNWKQYKRWEWFWESRVDPVTGNFPDNKVLDELYSQTIVSHAKSSEGNWTSLGPSTSDGGYAGVGRINCVAFHPTDNNVFWVGSPSGGLWKTINGGNTWTNLTDGNAVLGVSDIAIPSDYATSKTIYIATGDKDGGSMWSLGGGGSSDNNSIGVLKSTDDGATWVATGLTYTVSQNKRIGRLVIHPTNNDILLAGTSDGIKKTTNGGTSWSSVYSGSYIIDIEFKPGNPAVMYASNRDYYGTAKILESTNTGASWTAKHNFTTADYRVEIAVTPHDPLYMYAIVSKRNGGLSGIYRSTNGGTSFTELIDGSISGNYLLYYYSDGTGSDDGQGGYDLCIAVSPTDKNRVFIGGVNTWQTTDGGDNWEICNMWTSYSGYNYSGAPEVHADKHVLKYRSDGTLFEGNDGGIYKSTNNGVSWTDLTDGMVISQIYRLGVSQTDVNVVINGLQDNGSKMVNGTTWSDVTGGDGMECIVDYTNKNIQYSTYVRGEIYRTTNLWSNYTTISDNISDLDGGAWVTPYIIDQTNNSTLYVGYADVWKTTNKGDSFTKISSMNSSDLLRSMAIAPSNSNYLYVADHSHIWKTANGGIDWSNITGSLPIISNNITYIAVKHDDPLTLWVTMGGYNTQRVYESKNGGTTWANISTGLPELPVMSIVQNKQETTKTQLYVGTDVGVYVKHGSDDWILFSSGLPNVVVTELEIYYNNSLPANSKLRAATYGRGLWESDLYEKPVIIPVANFTASETSTHQGGDIAFTDASENEPVTWLWTFEGGTPSTSNQKNPTISYNTEGIYDVSLKVTNSAGFDEEIKVDYITVLGPLEPVADFTVSSNSIFEEQSIQFTDVSENLPTEWSWTFEGGTPNTSTEQHPKVAYNLAGIYDVTLVASNSTGSNEVLKTGFVTVEEWDDFPAPYDVTAVATNNEVNLTWSLVDVLEVVQGGFNIYRNSELLVVITDTTQFTYVDSDLEPGDYNYYLTAFYTSPEGVSIESNSISVHVYGKAIANFSAQPLSGILPLEVVFTNSSENADSFTWDFGDGNNSTDENPTHIFTERGNYTVTLLAKNDENTNEEMKTDFITVTMAEVTANFSAIPTEGAFPLEVTFENTSANAIDYMWDFGDDNTSSEKSPVHTYTEVGTYTVKLEASNDDFSDNISKSNFINVVWPMPVANFDVAPTVGVDPLTVIFTDMSENANAWEWDFGDGSAISSEQNPTHVYAQGTYTVSLLAKNPSGDNTIIKEDLILVVPNSLIEKYNHNLKVFPNPAKDKLSIEILNENFKQVVIVLYDGQGKVIDRVEPGLSEIISHNFNMGNRATGNYFLKVVIDRENIIIPIAKE